VFPLFFFLTIFVEIIYFPVSGEINCFALSNYAAVFRATRVPPARFHGVKASVL